MLSLLSVSVQPNFPGDSQVLNQKTTQPLYPSGLTAETEKGSNHWKERMMSVDYRSMWRGLGLDLEAHDVLMSVLGKAYQDIYQDIYLSQKNRPEGMGYFDFVMSEVHGLQIKELLDEKAAGRKIIGWYCVFVPEEIVLAANATLVGLCSGADFGAEDVEKLLPRNTCALIKSSFGSQHFKHVNGICRIRGHVPDCQRAKPEDNRPGAARQRHSPSRWYDQAHVVGGRYRIHRRRGQKPLHACPARR